MTPFLPPGINEGISLAKGDVDAARRSQQGFDQAAATGYSTGRNEFAEGGLQLVQGGANAVNGLQDVGVGIANTPANLYNAGAHLAGSDSQIGLIQSKDWSNNLAATEAGTHETSKFLGGNGAFTALTLGASDALEATSVAGRALNYGNTAVSAAGGATNLLNAASDVKEGHYGSAALNVTFGAINLTGAASGVKDLHATAGPAEKNVLDRLNPANYGLRGAGELEGSTVTLGANMPLKYNGPAKLMPADIAGGEAATTAAGGSRVAAAENAAGDAAGNKVKWVDENAHMGDAARDYDSGATGSRSNIATKKPQAPEITYKSAGGSDAKVRFDGQEGDTLIDRKTSVTTFPKSQNQALRQSETLAQNGLKGRWEVPTTAEKARAEKMFTKLGIKNITVEVVPQK